MPKPVGVVWLYTTLAMPADYKLVVCLRAGLGDRGPVQSNHRRKGRQGVGPTERDNSIPKTASVKAKSLE